MNKTEAISRARIALARGAAIMTLAHFDPSCLAKELRGPQDSYEAVLKMLEVAGEALDDAEEDS